MITDQKSIILSDINNLMNKIQYLTEDTVDKDDPEENTTYTLVHIYLSMAASVLKGNRN